jgi:hypothetical protein
MMVHRNRSTKWLTGALSPLEDLATEQPRLNPMSDNAGNPGNLSFLALAQIDGYGAARCMNWETTSV